MAPSTFASAAAGSNANSSRTDTGGDWSRRPNGATQTFRRNPSLSNSTQARDTAAVQAPVSTNPGVYVPPHLHSSRNGNSVDYRLSRDQLLDIFKTEKGSEQLAEGVSNLFAEGWAPSITNGTSNTAWGRREDPGKEQPGADVCWDRNGSLQPLGLVEMTPEEKEVFSASVNSPLKPPNQNQGKDGAKDGSALRKTSISAQSQNTPGGYGLNSPTGARPGTRRRETGDAFPFPAGSVASPSASRFPKDEVSNTVTPPPALVRRRTDFKDITSEEKEKLKETTPLDTSGAFGSIKRNTTGPFSAGINGPSSPWSTAPQSASFSPMGAFGSFALGPSQASTPDKRPGFGSLRGESRFKGLMNKDSSEDIGKGVKEKASSGNLPKVPETDSGRGTPSWMESRSKRNTSDVADPFPEDSMPTGSAALGGNQESSPPRRAGVPGFGTPSRQESRDDGFGAFGMTAGTAFRDLAPGDPFQHQTPHQQRTGGPGEPMSPTNTNPYQSPPHEKVETEDVDTDDSDIQNQQLPGLGHFPADQSHAAGMAPFGGLGGLGRVSGYEVAGSDRSQTSSAGPTRGFASLGGLGPLPGLGGSSAWPGGQASIGTPNRDKLGFAGGFGDVFSSNDIQSPSLAGLGGSGMFGSAQTPGAIGRSSSKLGSLFPAAMQEQMRASDQARHSEEGSVEGGDRMSASGFGRHPFGNVPTGGPPRDTDSPFRSGRGSLDEIISGHEGNVQFGGQSSAAPQPSTAATALPGNLGQPRNMQAQPPGQPQGQVSQPSAQAPSVSSSASNQPPSVQQRTMVMPDRMRWVYRDPQGNIQGPWSGLEMHDWYKAGFFSPELLVKKYEDPDYEPLAQLIRRIGNSREPFLVPQIGIPYGPPTTQPGNAWGSSLTAATGGAQPPFANSFPSFGTTLTAEQQNALERRKQEEQWLMARQKEHLAQQQLMNKMTGQHGMIPHQLHHHSSAHSLHSQPSFGSITSPGGYQPSPSQGPIPGTQPVPGFFDNSFRPPPQAPPLGPIGGGVDILGGIREEQLPGMMDRLNMGRGAQIPYGGAPAPYAPPQQTESNTHEQQVAAMLNDRARLQREQAEHDAAQRQNEQQGAQASADRLQQFHNLRSETESEHGGTQSPAEGAIGKSASSPEEPKPATQAHHEESVPEQSPASASVQPTIEQSPSSKPAEVLSLTEQVQKAQSAKQTPVQSPWAKVDTALPQPFPPPQSQSPLPAPAAQRKQNLADALHIESRSQSATPSVETPSTSIAPWAKEAVEAPKGPSLKEIQAAEAKKAAQQEEIAAAARRAALEKELMAQATAPPPAPGLPSTSTWASSASPVTPSASTPSAWAKPLAGKPPGQTAAAKKTLQQIQKEEEARKQRAAAAAAAAAATTTTPSVAPSASSNPGKRYADLAGKVATAAPAAPSSAGGGAWTTVGASGKIKSPQVPQAPMTPTRSTVVGPSAVPKPKPTPVQNTARTVSVGSHASGQLNAIEEFKKWAVGELKGDLGKGLNAEDIVTGLLNCPPELDLLTEAVHSVSQTIDSRHFAEEFMRRRKLADKGIVDNSGLGGEQKSAANAGGGWSEVAKKGGNTSTPKDETPANFKVVAPKRKGGKK